MASAANGLSVIRFGTFEVDVQAGELRRNGSRIKLQEQPFQVLIALLDRPGSVVTRDELQKKLWPADTFVDFDHSLNAAIRRLRETLGDSAENPRFVETVARRGYRFIAPVSGIELTAIEPPKVKAVSRDHRWLLWSGAAALVVLLAVGVVIGFRIGIRASRPPAPPIDRRLTANSEEVPVTGAAISPDGKYLAFSDKNGCFIRHIDTGEIHSIPLPANFTPNVASWFPDGLHLLVTAIAGQREVSGLWSVPIVGGQPQKLGDQGMWPTVSPDGSQILFVEQSEGGWLMPSGGHAIWLMQADGEKARRILENKSDEYGSSFGPPAWSPDGKRIAFVRNKYRAGTMDSESQIEIMNLASGEIEVAVHSPRLVGAVAWIAGGHLIYSASEAHPIPGDANLWEIGIDDRTNQASGDPVRLTADSGYVSAVSSSASGNRLSVLRRTLQPDVYVGTLQAGGTALGRLQRLTLDESDDYPFAWSPDDKSVLFASNRDGDYHIFRQALDQSEPELLLGGNQQLFAARPNPDGSQILYFVTPTLEGESATVRLMRVPWAGGPPQLVIEKRGITNHQCAHSPATLCIFSTIDTDGLHFFSYDPIQGNAREIPQLAIKTLDYSKHNWSLSPDGKTLASSSRQRVDRGGTLDMPVLQLTAFDTFSTRVIAVPNWANITSLDWASDGKSMWVGAHNNNTSALLNIDLNGHIQPVLKEDKMILGWAIPSHDGRRLALWEASGTANVWMVQRF